MPRYNPLLDRLPTYPAVALDRIKAEVVASGVPVYDFGTGDPVEPAPEFVREALHRAVTPDCPYPSVSGRKGVRAAISRYLRRRFGIEIDPDRQILPTSGSKEAVFHAPLLVVDPEAPDRTVVFPDPGYPAYQRGALFAGGEAHPVPLEGDFVFRPWLLPDDLLRRTRMLWINHPHNPSGALMSLDDLRRTVDLCRTHDIVLFADETYADIYQDEVPHSVLEAGVENVVALHSLSKRSGMTGYRAGFLAGDAAVIAKLKELRSNPGLAAQDFVNAAAEAAWDDDTHVEARRTLFRDKKALFVEFFRAAGIEIVASRATIYLWLKAPPGLNDETWAAALLRHGIVVSPGRMFGVSGAGAGYVRLALVPSLDQCRAAIEVWRKVDGIR